MFEKLLEQAQCSALLIIIISKVKLLGILGSHDVKLEVLLEKNRVQQKGLSKLQDSDSGFYKGKSIGRYGDVLPHFENHSYVQ